MRVTSLTPDPQTLNPEFPSGTAVQAYIDEELRLADGSTITDPPFATDLILYRGLDGGAGEARFHLAPSKKATEVILQVGYEHIRVHPYPGRLDRGTLIGIEGGRVPGDGTVSIDIPEGASPEPLHAEVSRLTAYPEVNGYTVVGGFQFTLTRATNPAPQDLDGDGEPDPIAPVQLFKPASMTYVVDRGELPAPDAQLILAEVLSGTEAGIIRLTALCSPLPLGEGSGVRVSTNTPSSSLPVDGLIREGTYLVLAANQPIAYATGLVRTGSPTGPIAAGARVTTSPGPQAPNLGVGDLVRQTGVYAIPVPAAGFALTPSSRTLGTGLPYENPTAVATASVQNIQLVLTAQPLLIEATTPANGASEVSLTTNVQVVFNAAVDPALVTSGSITVAEAVSGVLVPGATQIPLTPTQFLNWTSANDAEGQKIRLKPNARYSVRVDARLRSTSNAPLGSTNTFSFATLTQLTNTEINRDKIRITIPENGISTIIGDPKEGAVAGALPEGWQAIPVRRGRDFRERYQDTAATDGSFRITIGTTPGDEVSINDVIDLQIVNASGILSAVIRLTPFVTPDGLGFIAPPDRETRFTSTDGVTVTAPEDAFDEPTMVTVAKSDISVFADVPNVTNELSMVSTITLDFDGVAKKRIQVELTPDTPIDPAKTYYLGLLGQSSRGPRVMIVDTLRIDGTRLTTDDTSSAKRAKTQSLTASPEGVGTLKKVLYGVVESGTYSATSFLGDLTWVFLEQVRVGVEIFSNAFSSVYLADSYVNKTGTLAMPVRANQPFTITGVDAMSGFDVFSENYAAMSPTDPGVGATIPTPDADKAGPYPIFGGPFRVEVARLEAPSQKAAGLTLNLSGTRLTIAPVTTSGEGRLAEGVSVQAVNATTGFVSPLAHVDAGSFRIDVDPAKLGDRIIVLLGAAQVRPDASLSIVFSESIKLAQVPDTATESERDQLIQAWLAERVNLEVKSAEVWTDITPQVRFALDTQDRRVTLDLPASLMRGATYRLTLRSTIEDETSNALCTVLDSEGNAVGGGTDLRAEFSVLAPAGEIGSFDLRPGDAHPGAALRDMTRSGNLLFVSADDGGVLAYDLSDPNSLDASTGEIVAPIAMVPGRWQVDGVQTTNGFEQHWAVKADDHGRIISTGFYADFGALRIYKEEDFLSASRNHDQCPQFSEAPANAVCNFYGAALVSWRPGTSTALSLSTSTLSSEAAVAYPRRVQILTQDDDGDGDDSQTLTYTPAALVSRFGATVERTYTDGFQRLTVSIPMTSGHPYKTQRITIDNVTRGWSWHGDATSDQPAEITGIYGQTGDSIRIRRNLASYAVVSLFGYGITVVDLNAVESNSVSTLPRAVRERIILTRAAKEDACNTATSFVPWAINDLTFSPEALVLPTPESDSAANLTVHALHSQTGLLDARITLPSDETTPGSCVGRNDGLVFRSKPNDFTHPRLQEVTDKLASLGRNPIARFNSIAHYRWQLPRERNANGLRRSEDGLPVIRDYALIAAGSYGLLVVEVDGNPPPRTARNYIPLLDQHLVDVIWVPSGAVAVRLIEGTDLAAVVDAKGRVLLADLSRVDERWDASDEPTTGLFPTARAAMNASPVEGDETGVNDPRIVWASEPGLVRGTTPPIVDPVTGVAIVGEALGTKMRLVSVIDPQIRVKVMMPDGSVTVLPGVTPLGIDAAANAGAAFRVEVTLPGLDKPLAATNGKLRIAIESEEIFGALAGQTPVDMPRAHLRTSRRDGSAEVRATTLWLERLLPQGETPEETAAIAAELRHQKGFNTYVSPWFVPVADPRATSEYARQAETDCARCGRPGVLNNRTDANGVFEIWSGGRFFAFRLDNSNSTNPFAGTALAYLGEQGRLATRVSTIKADVVKPAKARVAGQNPPVLSGMLQERTYGHSGELETAHIDLVPGGRAGAGVTIARTYKSRVIGISLLGRGWDSPIFRRLRVLPSGNVEYRDGTGEVWVFTATGRTSAAQRETTGGTVNYASPKGLFLKLIGDGEGWTLLDQQWRGVRFDRFGRLTEEFDAFHHPGKALRGEETGNVIRYFYDEAGRLAKILDPVGRETKLTWWPDNAESPGYPGLLREVTDWRGRSVRYEYDELARLVRVRLPEAHGASDVSTEYAHIGASRPTIEYTYTDAGELSYTDKVDLAGNLTAIKSPAEVASDGAPRVSFVYGDAADAGVRDRVVSQTWGTGETATFDYSQLPVVKTVDVLKQTHLAEIVGEGANAHVKKLTRPSVLTFDPTSATAASPSLVATAEDLGWNWTYNSEGLVETGTYPSGLVETFTWIPAKGGMAGLILSNTKQQGRGFADIDIPVHFDDVDNASNTPRAIMKKDSATTNPSTREMEQGSRNRTYIEMREVGVRTAKRLDAFGREVEEKVFESSSDALATTPGEGFDAPATRQTTYQYQDSTANLLALGNIQEILNGDPASPSTKTSVEYAAAEAGGRKVTARDERGVTSVVVFDAYDRPVSSLVTKDAETLLDERNGYDASGRLTYSSRTQKGLGKVETTFEYDVLGRLIGSTTTDAAVGAELRSVSTSATYDLTNRTITETAPYLTSPDEAPKTVTHLDRLGRPDRVTQKGRGEAGEELTVRYAYDKSGSVSLETDGVRAAVATVNDALGRQIETIAPDNTRTKTTWTPWGEVVMVTAHDSAGGIAGRTTRNFTSKGLLRWTADEIDPDGRARGVWNTWDNGMQTTSVRMGEIPSVLGQLVSAPGRGVEQQTDSAGRVVRQTAGAVHGFIGAMTGEGKFSETLFSGFTGTLPTSQTTKELRGGGAEVQTRRSYDGLGRLASEEVGTGSSYKSVWTLDEAGNPIAATAPGMKPASASFDSRGLVRQQTAPDGSTIQSRYDALGNLVSYRDEAGKETTYAFDDLGRPSVIMYPDTTTEEIRYEPGTGLVLARRNRKGDWLSYKYDASNRITSTHLGLDPTTAPLFERYDYDTAGRLARAGSDSAAIEYAQYDRLGRPGLTRTHLYALNAGFTEGAQPVDTFTQTHVWSAFDGERTRWRMPSAGLVPADDAPIGVWRRWIAEERDSGANLVGLRGATSASSDPYVILATATAQGARRIASRSRPIVADGANLDTTWKFAGGAASLKETVHSGLPALVETRRGLLSLGGAEVTRDASMRVSTASFFGVDGRASRWSYDERGWIDRYDSGALAEGAVPSVDDDFSIAGFRERRDITGRLDVPQRTPLGAAAYDIEPSPWTATETDGHQFKLWTLSLAGLDDRVFSLTFDGGRRTADARWTAEYDVKDRLVAIQSQTRRIRYTYGPDDRIVLRAVRVRTDEQAQWQLENRDAAIQRDGLPPETSFVWDPATDRLVAIFETSESLLPGADGESALWRQYIHGDQAVDDPVEIGVRTADGSVKRFLPITNPLTGGSIEAVADTRGNLVERIVYADAWGDAPRYLHGPVVDRIRLNATKTPEGGVAEVRFEVHLSEALSEGTVAHGVRAVFSPSHAVGETAVETVAPVDGVLEGTNTVSITLTGAQWEELAASAAVVRVEVTSSLRASAWGEAPVMAAPPWARTALGVESSAQVPVSMPHDIGAINGFMETIASGKEDHRDAYTMSDLYLAADTTSAAKLLTGYKSAPFVEPLTNMAFFRDRWYDPATGSWLTPDKRGYSEASNLYAAFGNDPVNRHDPLGLESAEIMQRHWAAYQQGFDPYYMRPMSDAILEGLSHPVVQGGMQVAGGCGAAAVGVYAIAQTGWLAAAPGYLAVGYGWDMCMAGVGTWATGETQETLFVRGSNAALTGMGMDPEEAQWVTMGLDLAVGTYATLASGNLATQVSAAPDAAASSIRSYRTPYRMLSRSKLRTLNRKVADRTITRAEWKRLEWHKRFDTRRRTAIRRFWIEERMRLRQDLPGTRNWSDAQRAAILRSETPRFMGRPVQGHHTYSAMDYPHLANDPRFIYPTTELEHFLRWHGGTWGPTHGVPLNPAIPEQF